MAVAMLTRLTLYFMAESRVPVVAWSAGVSAAAAGLAALVADGKTPFDHILFTTVFTIGVIAFFILLVSGIPAFWRHAHRRGKFGTEPDGVRAVQPCGPLRSGKWVQQNVAQNHGRIFAAQGGNVIIHESGADKPPSTEPQAEENDGAAE
jgi:hypothetical protein